MAAQDVITFIWVHEKPGGRALLINLISIVAMTDDGSGGTFVWFQPNNAGTFGVVNRFNIQETIQQISGKAGFPAET